MHGDLLVTVVYYMYVCLYVCLSVCIQVSTVVPLVEGGHMAQEDSVCSVEYISDLESVCLALEGGDLLLCNVHTHQVDHDNFAEEL